MGLCQINTGVYSSSSSRLQVKIIIIITHTLNRINMCVCVCVCVWVQTASAYVCRLSTRLGGGGRGDVGPCNIINKNWCRKKAERLWQSRQTTINLNAEKEVYVCRAIVYVCLCECGTGGEISLLPFPLFGLCQKKGKIGKLRTLFSHKEWNYFSVVYFRAHSVLIGKANKLETFRLHFKNPFGIENRRLYLDLDKLLRINNLLKCRMQYFTENKFEF